MQPRGGGLERFSGYGPGMAQFVKPIGDGGGAAGDLHAQKFHRGIGQAACGLGQPAIVGGAEGHGIACKGGVVIGGAGGAGIGLDLVQVYIELFGDERGLNGDRPLALIGAGGDEDDRVRCDQHIGREGCRSLGQVGQKRIGIRRLVAPDAKGHAARNRGGAYQECAAGDGFDAAHRSDAPEVAGGGFHGLADARIGATATEITGHGIVNLGVGGIWAVTQQACGLHDLAGLAIAALRHLMRDPRGLHRMGGLGRAKPLDGGDMPPDIAHRHLTRAHSYAVDMHGAGPALRDATAVFRPREP